MNLNRKGRGWTCARWSRRGLGIEVHQQLKSWALITSTSKLKRQEKTLKFITLIMGRLCTSEQPIALRIWCQKLLRNEFNHVRQSSGLSSLDSSTSSSPSSSHSSSSFIGKMWRMIIWNTWLIICLSWSFILYSIFRAIIVGFLQTTSDYLLKPIIALLFNGFLQLIFTFVQNIFQSIADLLFPLTILLENILKPFTECLRAFRVVEIKNLRKDFVDRQNGKQQETDQKWKA